MIGNKIIACGILLVIGFSVVGYVYVSGIETTTTYKYDAEDITKEDLSVDINDIDGIKDNIKDITRIKIDAHFGSQINYSWITVSLTEDNTYHVDSCVYFNTLSYYLYDCSFDIDYYSIDNYSITNWDIKQPESTTCICKNEPVDINDDNEFNTWFSNTLSKTSYYYSIIGDAIDDEYHYLIQKYATDFINLINDELIPECLSFVLSQEYDELRDEYYEYLKDTDWFLYYTIQFSIAMQDNDYSTSMEYIVDMTIYSEYQSIHMSNIYYMIGNL